MRRSAAVWMARRSLIFLRSRRPGGGLAGALIGLIFAHVPARRCRPGGRSCLQHYLIDVDKGRDNAQLRGRLLTHLGASDLELPQVVVAVPQGDGHELAALTVSEQVEALEPGSFMGVRELVLGKLDETGKLVGCRLQGVDASEHDVPFQIGPSPAADQTAGSDVINGLFYTSGRRHKR